MSESKDTKHATDEFYNWEADEDYLDFEDIEARLNPRSLPVRLGRAALVGIVVVTSGAAVAGLINHRDAGYHFENAYARITETDCGTASPSERRFVDNQLDLPPPPALSDIANLPESVRLSVFKSYADYQAYQHGIDLVDESPFVAQVEKASDIDATTEALAGFLSQYDIELQMVEDDLDYLFSLDRENTQPVTVVDLAEYQAAARKFMRYFSFVPKQLVELGQVSKIKFFGSIYKETVSGLADFDDDEIWLDLDSFIADGPPLVLHELGHQIDKQLCGKYGAEKDSEYARLNPDGFSYNGRSRHGWTELVLDEHSISNVLEDKAEMFSYMMYSATPNLYDNKSAVLRNKYRLLLTRLSQEVPRVAEYFADISS